MELFRAVNYIIEVLLAELVFLHVFPRRERFGLRLAVVTALAVAADYPEAIYRQGNTSFVAFLLMVLVQAGTVVGMYFVFRGRFLPILSACVSGVALQHIGHHASRLLVLLPGLGPWNSVWEFAVCIALDAGVLWLLRGPLRATRYEENYAPPITIVSLVIVLLCTGVTRFLRLSGPMNVYAIICTSVYAITCCVLALLIQYMLHYMVQFKSEYLLLRRIREEERQQFEISREQAELINIKCHDLKHKLRSLEPHLPKSEIDSMREIIDSYDGVYRTGNDALDIVLNEKNMRCRSKNIALTYMGPGEELSFLEDMDVYSMLGNILDNAIDAADKFESPEKRVISMTLQRKGDFVCLNTINYLADDLSFADGLPRTTKEGEQGYHGYGLKSVREIARRHHGGISVSAADGIFCMSVYMMNE